MRTLNRISLCVSIAIVGAVSYPNAGGIHPPAATRPPATGQDPVTPPDAIRRRATRIVVSRPERSQECKATIDDIVIVGKLGKKVAWLVEDFTEDGVCAVGHKWRIELQFENEWNNGRDRIVKIDRDDIEDVRIHPRTPETEKGNGLKYKVYLVYPKFWGDDTRILVIDPELEIER